MQQQVHQAEAAGVGDKLRPLEGGVAREKGLLLGPLVAIVGVVLDVAVRRNEETSRARCRPAKSPQVAASPAACQVIRPFAQLVVFVIEDVLDELDQAGLGYSYAGCDDLAHGVRTDRLAEFLEGRPAEPMVRPEAVR